MKYITTKQQCQDNITRWDVVCSRCRGEVTPIETVDNLDRPTFWPGCQECQQIDYGVNVEIYDLSKWMVEVQNFRPYPHLGRPYNDGSKLREWYKSQISGTHSFVNAVISQARKKKLF